MPYGEKSEGFLVADVCVRGAHQQTACKPAGAGGTYCRSSLLSMYQTSL